MRKKPPISSETVLEKVSTTTGNSKKERSIKMKIFLNKLEESFKLTEKQKELSDTVISNNITIVRGVAGTGKTISICYTFLKMLFEGKIEKILFTKPLKESTENLGFIPGDVESKIAPFVESFLENCEDLIGPEYLKYLLDKKYIVCKPIAYMRGSTKKSTAMFLDEFQNCTPDALMLYITRFGQGSKMVLAGDISQTDIKQKSEYILNFLNSFRGVDGLAFFEFERKDIMRHPMLIEITDRYEKWKNESEKIKKGEI